MKKITLTFIACMAAMSLSAETVEQVIVKARANLGTDKALESVKTLEYKGRILDADGKQTGLIHLQFKRPYLQRLELDTPANVETTGVNGFEGWRERIDKENPLRSGILVLPPMQVQFLIANARENLNFFHGPETVPGGKITLAGTVEERGKDCWKVLFQYPGGLTYTRYFEKTTGKLVATQSGDSSRQSGELPFMVEKGNIEVAGIKFPKEVQTYNDDTLIRSVVFDEIKVNEPIADAQFDFPSIPKTLPVTTP